MGVTADLFAMLFICPGTRSVHGHFLNIWKVGAVAKPLSIHCLDTTETLLHVCLELTTSVHHCGWHC